MVKAALVHLDTSQQVEWVVDAVQATPEGTANDLADLEEDQAMTERALKTIRAGKPEAYGKALAALREDTRDWWQEKLTWEPGDYEEGEEPYSADATGLLRFLETEVRRWYLTHRKELENRPLIRSQAFGESLDPNKLERLARYEVHLDRKLERTLAMLIRLSGLAPRGCCRLIRFANFNHMISASPPQRQAEILDCFSERRAECAYVKLANTPPSS